MGSTSRITDTARKGDLRIAFGFERFNGIPQPHMFIHTIQHPRQMAAVPIRLMYLFDTREKDLRGEVKCMPEVKRLAEAIYGGMPSKVECHRVLSAIEDFMTDLKNMPPPSTWRNDETVDQVMAKHGYEFVG